MPSAKSLMVLGAASGVGKSVVAAGFCRLFSDRGLCVAPFKAQNMSNNSCVTPGGGEIGRAQAVQAECARVLPHTDMNPVLLKPAAEDGSQVVVHGKSIGHMNAREYFSHKEMIARAIRESYERLAAQYEILVIEGAGSPAELNLKENDLVNMKMAELADARCVLVADIDRGGVFAQLLGTLDLLEPHERARIGGLIVNKFRGDLSLFADGVKILEEKSGKKVWGVLPFDRELWIEEEDTLCHPRMQLGGDLGDSRLKTCGNDEALDIAVVLLPRMSNFTDFEILAREPDVRLRYLKHPSEIGVDICHCEPRRGEAISEIASSASSLLAMTQSTPDLLILPGTKSTIADLEYLIQTAFREKILEYARAGGRILGICGGYQMMGETIRDPAGVESAREKIEGLGFFKMTTEFFPEKILRRAAERVSLPLFGARVEGALAAYEIHMGKGGSAGNFSVHPSGKIAGTYYHGLFEADGFRRSFLAALAADCGKVFRERDSVSARALKERHYARLAALLRQNLNLDLLAPFFELLEKPVLG